MEQPGLMEYLEPLWSSASYRQAGSQGKYLALNYDEKEWI